ncbi:hypothetical protein O1611_g9998 [Lasiodiplodia mahajangana]|uniref:Uncharacterized protein n=1 Tax=Lasiodiplodia mahajangana TaxID=1108764 RepID=A0ACC2J3P7_9PEZI|nr:hypothetical protein O1611_g9998 [Lasiodiplodia mahajangana]
MFARLNVLCTRRFPLGAVRRVGPSELSKSRLSPNHSRKKSSQPLPPSPPPSSPPPPSPPPTTQSHHGRATDTISIMGSESARYNDGTRYSSYLSHVSLPLGQANAILPPSTPGQPTIMFHAGTGGSRRSRSPRRTHRDEIIQPSPESGGIPDPTHEYLTIASHPPFLLPQPRNILVVVDLNGTLLHRPNRHNPTLFVERPYARPFLSYCINTFTVVIWSSARPENVNRMCKQLLTPKDRAKVVAVWGRDSFGFSEADYNQRVQCYKRLTSLWNDPIIAASHPMAANGEKWNQSNTVLVDDSSEKARSEPFNLVQIPEFKGNAAEPGFVLPQVHDYLNDCSQQANVSAYMKSRPFMSKPEFTLPQT